MPVPPEPPEQAGRSLYARLQIQDQKDALLARSQDLIKNVKGVRNDMELTTRMTDIVADERKYLVHVESSKSLRDIVAGHSDQQRTANTLEMMQVILAGSLAFDILDACDWRVDDYGFRLDAWICRAHDKIYTRCLVHYIHVLLAFVSNNIRQNTA